MEDEHITCLQQQQQQEQQQLSSSSVTVGAAKEETTATCTAPPLLVPHGASMEAVHNVLMDGPCHEPTRMPIPITPWLFLSGLLELSDKGYLLELGITHVLTTNKLCSDQEVVILRGRLGKVGIDHWYVPGLDEPDYDMIAKHWEQCRTYLEHVRTNDSNKVVVHCAAGQNRSALIVGAALVTMERMELLDAVKLLKAKRGIVLTNVSFQKLLCLLAAKEGLLGERPPDEYYANDDDEEPAAGPEEGAKKQQNFAA